MAAIVRGEAHGDTDRHAVTAGGSKALPLQAAVKVARDTHHFVSAVTLDTLRVTLTVIILDLLPQASTLG